MVLPLFRCVGCGIAFVAVEVWTFRAMANRRPFITESAVQAMIVFCLVNPEGDDNLLLLCLFATLLLWLVLRVRHDSELSLGYLPPQPLVRGL